jgi:hypothetical protein
MSSARRSLPVSAPTDVVPSTLLATAVRTARASVRFVAFWLAVALPFCYLPLLAGGLPATEAKAFAALVAVNVFGLVVGRNYGE